MIPPPGSAVVTDHSGRHAAALVACSHLAHTSERNVEMAAPSGIARIAVRGILPLMHLAPLRRLAVRLLAGVRTPERPGPRRHSWAHALVEWPDGTTREGWLRLGDANDVTASVAAEVAPRLAADRGTPGVYTPAELFGAELAQSCGGVYSLANGRT